MANSNSPAGLTPLYNLCGGEITSTPYIAYETIYKGDIVVGIPDGKVATCLPGYAYKVIGVAANYAEDGEIVNVYDNPFIVYSMKANGNVTPEDVFAIANHVVGTPNPVTKVSGHMLDSATIGSGIRVRIIRKVEDGKNDWGDYVTLEVILVETVYHNTYTI